MEETLNPTAPALEFKDFSFAYPTGTRVLEQVNLRIEQGAFALLVGNTGCGKTTLLRNAKPEIAPVGKRTGCVSVFGKPLSFDAESRSLDVGYVFQDPANQIVCDTVLYELAFGLENYGYDPDTMRRRVAEVAHFFGMESWLDRKVNTLSGGQKQTLNLAAILALRPRLLLLDEPTAQLDPIASKNFLHELFRVNRELGITVVLATHTPEEARAYATTEIRLGDAPGSIGTTTQPIPTTPNANAPTVITARDMHFKYGRELPAVFRGLDLTVANGSVHALLGGNACGKTTLLSLIARALKPQHGKLENKLMQSQALLPQDPKALFACDSVLEELAEWQKRFRYSDEDIEAVLHRLGLSNQRDQHPYDLSGGQQQLLALAKLLLAKPELLLLDEPTKGLDAPTRLVIAQILQELRSQGVTVVISSHDMSFVKCVADTVTLLFNGEAACTLPTGEFFKDNLFYQ